jgi:acetyltransferase-like isoleucine patch superfamily enzyme
MIGKLFRKALNFLQKARVNAGNDSMRIDYLRRKGVKIGKNCLIFTLDFSTEPYLVEIGDHVVIARGTKILTHDGATWLFRDKYPNLTVFGRVIIKDNTFLGTNCTILAGTEIGKNCIIGAGSVVRGIIPDNSVVMGNPAKVVMKTSIAEMFLLNSKDRIDTKHMSPDERKEVLMKHYFPKDQQNNIIT